MPASVINTPTPARNKAHIEIADVVIADNIELSQWLQHLSEDLIDIDEDTMGLLPLSRIQGRWEPLANGDPVDSELIFAAGDVIMVQVPQ